VRLPRLIRSVERDEGHAERSPTEMTLEDARHDLVEAGYRIRKEERLGNNTGTKLSLDGGAIVHVFDNGNYSCQGKNCEVVEALLDRGIGDREPKPVS
jgi:predicted nucleotide-binding protein